MRETTCFSACNAEVGFFSKRISFKKNIIEKNNILNWFSSFNPEDVPAVLQRAINSGSSRAMASDSDVIVFVKKYISDPELAQEPLLVMTATRASGFNLVPNAKTLSLI